LLWAVWRPTPIMPMPMRSLGAGRPSAPNTDAGTTTGAATAAAAAFKKRRRVTDDLLFIIDSPACLGSIPLF
jgi:hypothetical protein